MDFIVLKRIGLGAQKTHCPLLKAKTPPVLGVLLLKSVEILRFRSFFELVALLTSTGCSGGNGFQNSSEVYL